MIGPAQQLNIDFSLNEEDHTNLGQDQKVGGESNPEYGGPCSLGRKKILHGNLNLHKGMKICG